MKLILNSTYIVLLIFLFYAVKWSIDPTTWSNFWTFMAGDYPMLWDKYFVPYLSLNPSITLVIGALLILGVVRIALGGNKHEYR